MKNEDIQLVMGTVDFIMDSINHIIFNTINYMFDTMPAPTMPAVALP